jgi:hypothetical protein
MLLALLAYLGLPVCAGFTIGLPCAGGSVLDSEHRR